MCKAGEIMDTHAKRTISRGLDPEMYTRILVAITKADPSNGKPEKAFVRHQATSLSVDFDTIWNDTDKSFEFGHIKVSRQTALTVLRDCILLAGLDGNFSLSEKERVYVYAEKLHVPRSDVKKLEQWVEESRELQKKWLKLLAGELI